MFALFGLALGVALGLLIPATLPSAYSLYTAVGLLAALDTVFGGVNANLKGHFHSGIFLSGVLGNAVIAVGLTYLGQRMGIDLYLAAVVFFGGRLFQNFAEIRRLLLTGKRKKDTMEHIVDKNDVEQ